MIEACTTRPMSEETMRIVYKAFEERKSCNHDRDLLIMHLCMVTGCRPGEALKAKIREFNLSQGVWYVPDFNEKTGHNKRYYLSRVSSEFIAAYYLKHKARIDKNGGWIAPSRKGGYIDIAHFSNYVYTPVIRKLGLYEPVPFHKTHKHLNKLYSIRGGVFISLHKRGYSLEEIKTLSQHLNVSTLERWYLRYDQEATQKKLINETNALIT